MISMEDALEILKWHDTFAGNSHGLASHRTMAHHQANQIEDLIEHLVSKCDLEVKELLGEDTNGN